ncbi:MAG: YdcF family protein [Chlorobi bacterium]|nr:YdcF family protein [Chlorobiota bacterium]
MKRAIVKIVKWFFCLGGVLAFVLLLLSFTDIPYYAYHGLGIVNSELKGNPDVIVIPGGSGMPCADGLIRTYYGAIAANHFPDARIIIALPYDTGVDSLLQLNLMARELILKGVDSTRIAFEPLGFNTWSQAINIGKMPEVDKSDLSILIVTSPEHVYRAVKTYEKAGFPRVFSMAAFEKPIDEEKLGSKGKMKGLNLSVRYNMWSYLNYELLVLKEYVAIVYYKLKGWI